jgi:hypothetical protein
MMSRMMIRINRSTPPPIYISASFQSCADEVECARDVPGPAASDTSEKRGAIWAMRAGGLEPPREFPPNGT